VVPQLSTLLICQILEIYQYGKVYFNEKYKEGRLNDEK